MGKVWGKQKSVRIYIKLSQITDKTQRNVHNLLKKRKRENEQGICETEAE